MFCYQIIHTKYIKILDICSIQSSMHATSALKDIEIAKDYTSICCCAPGTCMHLPTVL
jgi:hypothetical protein